MGRENGGGERGGGAGRVGLLASSPSIASSRCSLRTSSWFRRCASSSAPRNVRFAAPVKGSGSSSRESMSKMPPFPFFFAPSPAGAAPTRSLTAERVLSSSIFAPVSALRAPSGSWMTPSSRCSVPTSLQPMRRVSCCACMSTLTALGPKRSNIIQARHRRAARGAHASRDEPAAPRVGAGHEGHAVSRPATFWGIDIGSRRHVGTRRKSRVLTEAPESRVRSPGPGLVQ